MNSGVGLKLVLDPALLWLWCRPAAAAPIQPLAWEPPYAMGMALKRQKKKKKILKKRKHTHAKWLKRNSRCGAVETNLTRNHEILGLIPGLAQWGKDLVLP